MKCPKCGITNGSANRYCRGCGLKLERPEDASPAHGIGAARDEVALGEELFRIWQLFEAGDLDSALQKGEAIARVNGDSASAHSLVALIYERKAERDLAAGRLEDAREHLKLAIAQYERIIDLNPDSSADREKLASLRVKLAGRETVIPRRALAGFRAEISKIPPQLLAAFGAFLVILFLAIVLAPGGEKRPASARQGRVRLPVTASAPRTPPAPQPLSVYTFPTTPRQAPARVATPPEAKALAKPPEPKPAKITVPEISVVPAPKAEKPKPTQPGAGQNGKAQPPPAPSPPASGGATMLAQAIALHSEGRVTEAIGAAHQAIALFQIDVESGKNVDAAQRGIANARKMIALWEQ